MHPELKAQCYMRERESDAGRRVHSCERYLMCLTPVLSKHVVVKRNIQSPIFLFRQISEGNIFILQNMLANRILLAKQVWPIYCICEKTLRELEYDQLKISLKCVYNKYGKLKSLILKNWIIEIKIL